MSGFVECLPDEEYEALKERGLAIIRTETKESIETWLRYDNECIMQEMLESCFEGKVVAIASPNVISVPSSTIESDFIASNDNIVLTVAA